MATLFDEKVWPALGSEVLGRSGGFRRVKIKSKTKGEVFCWGLEGERDGEEGERDGEEGERDGEEGERDGE